MRFAYQGLLQGYEAYYITIPKIIVNNTKDNSGNVTDTFTYDTYGKLLKRTGTSDVVFGYNGRDGVVTEENGLIYMRARYYSPAMRRFINADIVAGQISNAVTLNRFAYANGNPVILIDPLGRCADKTDNESSDYDESVYDSQALRKIKENEAAIEFFAYYYDVDPNVVASVIFVEQYYNYNWIDVCTDWISFYGIIDMSVGLGQVRLSTAEFLEENGYVSETSAEEGGWYIPLIGFVHGTETMAREKRLEDDFLNIMYVAAYIKALEDLWSKEFPEIGTRPDILGSLYNLGHEKTPHDAPQANWFGQQTAYFYDLMEETLNWERLML